MNAMKLPLKRSIDLAYTLSVVAGLLMAGLSLLGLVYQSSIYPTVELRNSFVANDVVNLVIGLPILFGSMRLTRGGQLVGLLFWPGALLYIIYNYLAYVFGIPFGGITIAALVLVLLSASIIFYLLNSIDKKSVKNRLEGVTPAKSAGLIMLLFGAAFFLRAIVMVVQAITGQTSLRLAETGVLIADIVISVLWIAGSILLLRRMPLGYVSGLGLLFAASMLFVGLIAFLLLQPVFTDIPLAPIDVIVVLVMGVICSIPFVLFTRSVAITGKDVNVR
jgi:hypothetical protein